MNYVASESLGHARSMTSPVISTIGLVRDSPGRESTPSPSLGRPRESLSRRSTLTRTSLVPAGPRPLPQGPVRSRTISSSRTTSPPPVSPVLSGVPAPPLPPVPPLFAHAAAVPRPLSPTRRLVPQAIGARQLSITAVKSLASVPMLPFSSATTVSNMSPRATSPLSPRATSPLSPKAASPTVPTYNARRMSPLYEAVPPAFAMRLSREPAPLTADSCAPELTPDEGSSEGWEENVDDEEDDQDAAVSISGYSRSDVGSAMNAIVQTAVRVGFHESDGTNEKFTWPDPWAPRETEKQRQEQPSHPPTSFPRLRVVVPRRTLVVCNATGVPESPKTPLPPRDGQLPSPSLSAAAHRKGRTKSHRSGKSLHRMSQSSGRRMGGGTAGRRAAARMSLISNTTSGSTLPTFASTSAAAGAGGPSSPFRTEADRPPSPDLLHPLYKRSQSPPVSRKSAKGRKSEPAERQPLSMSAIQQLHHVQEEDPFELAARSKGLRLLGADGPHHVPAPVPNEPMASPIAPQPKSRNLWRLTRVFQPSRQKVPVQSTQKKKPSSFTMRRIFGRNRV